MMCGIGNFIKAGRSWRKLTPLFFIAAAASLCSGIASAADSAQGSRNKGATAATELKAPKSSKSEVQSRAMEKRWTELQKTIRPDHLLDMCAAFSRDFPESKYGEALVSLQAGVGKAMSAIRAAQLTVDVIDETSGDNAHLSDLRSAMRGDKDSAYRIAAMYRRGSNGLAQDVRRGEQWLQVSAELGRGDASWELAEIYNRRGMVAEAARFEVMALESGFKPPPRLPSRDRNL